jgi:hypothetical protein
MKQFFRAVTLVLLVGGWALASAAVHVIRTPSQSFPLIVTKDHLGYHDTYVDTTRWTLNDDRAHSDVVLRLIHLNQTGALSHTVNSNGLPVEAQLLAAVSMPTATASATPTVIGKAKLN